MAFPSFLSPHTEVVLAARAPRFGAPNEKKLNLSVQHQKQDYWCWAAVSTSISLYYTPASPWTQCKVADAALRRTDCCGAGAADPQKCNTPWYLNAALNLTGNLDRMEGRSLSFSEVQAEIQRGAPIGTRVGWFDTGAGGHFQTIVGWLVTDRGIQYIDISDPIYLDNQIVFSQFASGYQSGGDWTHSYFTRTPPPVVAVAAAGGAVASFAALDPNALGG